MSILVSSLSQYKYYTRWVLRCVSGKHGGLGEIQQWLHEDNVRNLEVQGRLTYTYCLSLSDQHYCILSWLSSEFSFYVRAVSHIILKAVLLEPSLMNSLQHRPVKTTQVQTLRTRPEHTYNLSWPSSYHGDCVRNTIPWKNWSSLCMYQMQRYML